VPGIPGAASSYVRPADDAAESFLAGVTATHSARPCQIGQVTVFARFSGLRRVRITVALMMVAERRLRFLDVTGPG